MSLIDIFVAWLSYALMLWFSGRVLPSFEVSDGFRGAAVTAVVLSILSAIAGWVLFGIFQVDDFIGRGRAMQTLLHWGVNAGLLFATDKITDQLTIENPGMGVLAAIVISVGGDIIEPMLYSLLDFNF